MIAAQLSGGEPGQHLEHRIRESAHVQHILAGLRLSGSVRLKINANQPSLRIALPENFSLPHGFGAAPMLRIGP